MSGMNERTHRGDDSRPSRRSKRRLPTDVEVSARELAVGDVTVRADAPGYHAPPRTGALFEELLAHVPLSVMVLDAGLRVVYLNRAASDRLGQSPDEACGRGAEDIVRRMWPEPQGDEFVRVLQRTLASGKTHHISERAEYRIAHRRHEYSEWTIERIDLRDGQPGLACYARDVTEQVQAREELRRDESDARQLQSLSAELVRQDDVQALYEQLVEGAATLMRSQFASMQILHPERGASGELQLLAHRGFDAKAIDYWRWVPIDSGSTCGEAMRTGQRVMVSDVETCEFMAGTQDLAELRRLGIRASQSTPLVARGGRLLGMISTHWDRPHQPSARDLANLDLIARQAADLIERRQAADALRESRDVLSLVMRGGRIGAWSRKPGTNVVWWSRELEEIFGFPPGGFAGTQEAFVELVHPDDRSGLARAVGDATEGGGDYAVEFRFRHTSGEWRWMEGRGRAVYDADGATMLYGVGVDITEQKRAEQHLRFLADVGAILTDVRDLDATLDRLTHLAVSFLADWCMIDLIGDDGRIRRVAAAHVDPDRQSLLDELASRYPPTWDFPSPTVRVMRTGRPERRARLTPTILRAVTRDRAHRRMVEALGARSVIVVPLLARGEVLGAVSLVRGASSSRYGTADLELAQDLARRVAMAVDGARLFQQIEASNRRKDEFLAVLAHELRNPLAPIRTGLELMRLGGDSAESVAQVRPIMERQVAHLVRLVDDLLDIARITSGRIELQRQPTALAPLIASAVEANRTAMDAAGLELAVDLPEAPVIVNVDPTRLVQVIANLLQNATKFTDRGGQITVAARVENDVVPPTLVLTVRDTGIGIAAELLPRVFDLFASGDDGHRGKAGLGIGLALARQLVEMHGGRIEVASSGTGAGSTFTIRLPVMAMGTLPRPDASPARAPRIAGRVLIVDDNVDAAELLAALVRRLGGQAETAYGGAEGLERAATFRPNVVLLDIGMPEMDGYEACRRLRAAPHGRHALVVALTGWGQHEDRERALAEGFDAHLTKPADPQMLESLLAGSLRPVTAGRGQQKARRSRRARN